MKITIWLLFYGSFFLYILATLLRSGFVRNALAELWFKASVRQEALIDGEQVALAKAIIHSVYCVGGRLSYLKLTAIAIMSMLINWVCLFYDAIEYIMPNITVFSNDKIITIIALLLGMMAILPFHFILEIFIAKVVLIFIADRLLSLSVMLKGILIRITLSIAVYMFIASIFIFPLRFVAGRMALGFLSPFIVGIIQMGDAIEGRGVSFSLIIMSIFIWYLAAIAIVLTSAIIKSPVFHEAIVLTLEKVNIFQVRRLHDLSFALFAVSTGLMQAYEF